MSFQPKGRQKGLGLIELLISLVIALLLGLAVGGVFIVAKRGFSDAEDFARIQDNGRYMRHRLVRDFLHVGLWGDMLGSDIVPRDGLRSATWVNRCSGAADPLDTTFPLFGVRLGSTQTGTLTCVSNAAPSSDVLVVKQVKAAPLQPGATLNPQTMYVASNFLTGVMFDGGSASPPTLVEGGDVPNGRYWAYETHVYYVRVNPADATDRRLYRMQLSKNGVGAWTMVNLEVADGIETMRILFGVDSDGNGELDQWVNSNALATAADWESVLAAQVFLLVRGDQDNSYTDTRTYAVGDITAGPFNDNFHRSVMTATVSLRNPLYTARRSDF